jgi:hypothetical protein
MKTAWTGVALVGLTVAVGGAPLFAQLRDNTEKTMTCENGGYDGDRARHCEIREQSVPSVGRLSVDLSHNGGATVKGWLRSEVLVRSRVESSADTQTAAASLASRVTIDTSAAQVRSLGPDTNEDGGWSVSYEIFEPQSTDLDLKGTNGGLTVSDVRGQPHFDVKNGGVHLKRVAGDISGGTINGGIQVDLAGASFDGRQMEITTHNGGVTVTMPANYSAHLQAETGLGNIQSDFPVTLSGSLKSRKVDFSVGAGGPLIHVTTSNGGVHFKKAETE